MSKDLTEALDALMRQQRQQRPKPPTPRGGAAPQISSGVPGGASGEPGDGVASPLVEQDSASREYYQDGWQTTDGLFTLPAIKRAFFVDANGRPVEFHFGAPK